MKTIKDISATQTALNDDDYFELQENAGTSKKTLWSTIRDTIALFVGAGTTAYKQATYVMLDNDGYSRIEVDTTAGAVSITLPLPPFTYTVLCANTNSLTLSLLFSCFGFRKTGNCL